MNQSICASLGIDLPLLAFSHCRDVVAAVTNAGGFGVLGAGSYTAEELDRELTWIDDHVHGRPYGVDIVCPARSVTLNSHDPADLVRLVPQEHRDYVESFLKAGGLDITLQDEDLVPLRVDAELGLELLEVSFRHPIKLMANALGVPTPEMVEQSKAAGVPVAALVGAAEHAVKQVAAGVDIIVAQGTEAGGHTGEVSTLVLVPEVIEAIVSLGPAPVPVLAAGGIVTGRQMAAAIALGAAGVWTGSVWLTTEEAETAPATMQRMLGATSRDAVRSTGRTGKPSRQLRSRWTDAWRPEGGGPVPLGMPLQSMISEPALRRVDRLAEAGDPAALAFATYFVGQGVGLMNKIRPAREVVREMSEDFIAATERLASFMD